MVTWTNADEALNWESEPSTRQSVHTWTKYQPVDVTLTTAGTAQTLYATSSAGTPTVNLATNPSFETGDPPTSYTASGATLARSATIARSYTNSLRITPANIVAGEGAYFTTPLLGSGSDRNNVFYLVVSAYFNDNAGSGNNARIAIRDTSNALLFAGNNVALAAAWNRSSVVFPLTITGTAYRIFFETAAQFATVFFVDDFQVEIRRGSDVTAYCDGAQGLNYEWQGTAHASASRRRRGVSVIRGFSLHFSRDTYIAFDQTTASSATGTFVRAGSDWTPAHPLNIRTNISFVNVNVGELPRVWGALHGVHAGDN